MTNSTFKVFFYFCYLLCTSATIGFICFCLYKYSLDDDVSQVTFQEFHKENDNLYPSLTICTSHIYFDDNFKLYGEGINLSTYTDFLKGDYWDDILVKVDYDNVTLNFLDYLLGINMWTPDWRHLKGDKYFLYDHKKFANRNATTIDGQIDETNEWVPNFRTIYKGASSKCFTVDIPYIPLQKVWTFGIVLDADMFPGGIRPNFYEFGVMVHYPGQFFDSKIKKYQWEERSSNSSSLTMKFLIQRLEIIKNRNTKKHRCHEKWKENDEKILLDKIKELGCKPPWWSISSNLPVCRSKEKVKMLSEFNPTNYTHACRTVQKILYTYQEFGWLEDYRQEWFDDFDRLFEVVLEFQDGRYMEIQQIRAYSIEDLVGDIGGYLGLFLGFSLLQIPELLFKIYFLIAGWFSRNKLNMSHSKKKEQTEGVLEVLPTSAAEEINKRIEQNIADISVIKKMIHDIRVNT